MCRPLSSPVCSRTVGGRFCCPTLGGSGPPGADRPGVDPEPVRPRRRTGVPHPDVETDDSLGVTREVRNFLSGVTVTSLWGTLGPFRHHGVFPTTGRSEPLEGSLRRPPRHWSDVSHKEEAYTGHTELKSGSLFTHSPDANQTRSRPCPSLASTMSFGTPTLRLPQPRRNNGPVLSHAGGPTNLVPPRHKVKESCVPLCKVNLT